MKLGENMYSTSVFSFLALALWACSPEVPKMIPEPKIVSEKIDIDSGAEVFDPKLDILFVVDDSGSMHSHQNNLARNIFLFINGFVQRKDIDYHIGVITTSMESYSWGSPSPCCGQLVDNGGVKFVTPTTPNIVSLLATNLRVGTDGSGTEKVFSPLRTALSPLYTTGVNAGFYRDEAHLAVVIITDAEDQSVGVSARDTYQFLTNLKGRPEKLLSFGVIVPSLDDRNCGRDTTTHRPLRIEEFLKLSGQGLENVFNLCDPKFADNLVKVADYLVRSVGNVIYLSRSPILETIRVTFGSQVVPADPDKGWSYDPLKNALILGQDVEWSTQPSGTRVRVYYDAAYYKPEISESL